MVGIDIVDVGRLRAALLRSPRLAARLFTRRELDYARSRRDPDMHLAGTLAAKEATIKAMQLGSLPSWATSLEVTRSADGSPVMTVERAGEQRTVAISISHDAGIATAVAAVRQGEDGVPGASPRSASNDRIPALVCTPPQLADRLAEAE
ncbi:MAG: holo-ACP synthase [Actinomycetota bacterium]